jgi:hypothetical protein
MVKLFSCRSSVPCGSPLVVGKKSHRDDRDRDDDRHRRKKIRLDDVDRDEPGFDPSKGRLTRLYGAFFLPSPHSHELSLMIAFIGS